MLDYSVAKTILEGLPWPEGVRRPNLSIDSGPHGGFLVHLYRFDGRTLRVLVQGPTTEVALALAVESWLVAHGEPLEPMRARARLTN